MISNEKRSIHLQNEFHCFSSDIVKVMAFDLSGEMGQVKYFYEIVNIVVRRKMFLLSLDILDKCVIC